MLNSGKNKGNEEYFTNKRQQMVKSQLIPRGIGDEKVLKAMKTVPRHEFVPGDSQNLAYQDSALPIEEQQTISQPYIVALMIEALKLKSTDHVLDIGTGSGYAAAVLSQIVEQVYTVEFFPELANEASQRFSKLGYNNIDVKIGDGSKGWQTKAPFDGILISAAVPDIPDHLMEQLNNDGKVVLPVGEKGEIQRLFCLHKKSSIEIEKEDLGLVRFVPLLGDYGQKTD